MRKLSAELPEADIMFRGNPTETKKLGRSLGRGPSCKQLAFKKGVKPVTGKLFRGLIKKILLASGYPASLLPSRVTQSSSAR